MVSQFAILLHRMGLFLSASSVDLAQNVRFHKCLAGVGRGCQVLNLRDFSIDVVNKRKLNHRDNQKQGNAHNQLCKIVIRVS